MQTKPAHPDDVTYDDDFQRIAILKRPLNFFFLVFLRRSSSKLVT